MPKEKNYVSEVTVFINDLLKQTPDLSKQQQQLVNTWSNKDNSEVMEQRQYAKTNLAVPSYAYYEEN